MSNKWVGIVRGHVGVVLPAPANIMVGVIREHGHHVQLVGAPRMRPRSVPIQLQFTILPLSTQRDDLRDSDSPDCPSCSGFTGLVWVNAMIMYFASVSPYTDTKYPPCWILVQARDFVRTASENELVKIVHRKVKEFA